MTRKELLTEAAAWRKLAEWVMRRTKKRRFLCHRLTPDMTCGYYDRPPATWPINTMRYRLVDHNITKNTLDDDETVGDKDNGTRSLFALLMAIECEEEARA